MCSRNTCPGGPSSPTPALRGLAFLALVLLALGACGKKGDPLPPLRAIPAPVQDLALHQQGTDFILSFSYPKATISGGPLPGINRIELLSATFPPPAEGFKIEVEPRRFAAAAEVSRLLNEADLSSATSGDSVFLRLPVPAATEAERKADFFGVRILAANGEISGLSNVVGMVPGTPPEPPKDLAVVPGPDGLTVRWQSADEPAEGFVVYRRDATSRAYRQPGREVAGDQLEYLDTSARFGRRYIYTVTSIGSRDPLVESRLSGEAEVFYQDRFAPAPPAGIVALSEIGQVRLRWDPSTSADAVSYHVYRKDEGDFRRLTRISIGEREYLDTSASSGRTYTYRVTALDALGNEGESGDEVTVVVR
jgi:hypothetical protein